ncbi:profilin-1-like [Stigmatopora argus]
MSWSSYVDALMAGDQCDDAAIVGYLADTKYVWASHNPNGFAKITTAEIDSLLKEDHTDLLINGLTLGGYRCSIIRDAKKGENDWLMDLRTKNVDGGPTYNITLAKSNQVFVIAMGKAGIGGGILNEKAYQMCKNLKEKHF